MTSKAVLKLAEELLDRLFRDAEGAADHEMNLDFLFENVRTTLEKAEPALEYLQSRGLIHPVSGDGIYLTTRGVDAIAKEQDIKEMPKYQKQWGAPTPSQEPPPTPQGPARPYRPILEFVDPEGQKHTFNLSWIATVGRSDAATLKLPDPRASKQHVEIKYGGDHYIVRDLGSANGTLVNGHHVDVRALAHGDVMLIGRTEVMYLCPDFIPAPTGEPPPEMAAALKPKPFAPVDPALDRTERPARTEPRPEPMPPPQPPEPPTVKADAPGLAPTPRQQSRGEPDPTRPSPEPVRGAPEPARPSPQPQAAKAPTPAVQTGAKRRTAPAPPESVPIVKGRPEAPPVVASSAGGDLFAAPARDRLPADLFGEPPRNVAAAFGAQPDQSRDDLFKEGSLPPAIKTRPGVSADATSRPDGGAGDLFDDSETRVAPSRKKDPPARAGGGDLFAPSSAVSEAAASDDLFAGNKKAATAPDLFAPRNEQRAPDLFAPDYAQKNEPLAAPPQKDDLFGGSVREGSVSPLPADVQPTARGDLFDDSAIPFEQAEELEPVLASQTHDTNATIATMSPILSRRTMPLEPEAREATTMAPASGLTSELPAWGNDRPASENLKSYAPPDDPRDPPRSTDGFTDEVTPVEGRGNAAADRIVAAAADLPEAPSELPEADVPDAPILLDEGVATSDLVAVSFDRFSETLVILRARLSEAGVPDEERLLESIELLRKHPSVRAALTEPSSSR